MYNICILLCSCTFGTNTSFLTGCSCASVSSLAAPRLTDEVFWLELKHFPGPCWSGKSAARVLPPALFFFTLGVVMRNLFRCVEVVVVVYISHWKRGRMVVFCCNWQFVNFSRGSRQSVSWSICHRPLWRRNASITGMKINHSVEAFPFLNGQVGFFRLVQRQCCSQRSSNIFVWNITLFVVLCLLTMYDSIVQCSQNTCYILQFNDDNQCWKMSMSMSLKIWLKQNPCQRRVLNYDNQRWYSKRLVWSMKASWHFCDQRWINHFVMTYFYCDQFCKMSPT